MITINSTPEAWGFTDGFKGRSLYAGYNYFCGSKFSQYEQGFEKGKALFDRLCWDNGKGSHKLGYSLPTERTEQRTEKIIAQVRFAVSVAEYRDAMQAVCDYDPDLSHDLSMTYGPKWNKTFSAHVN